MEIRDITAEEEWRDNQLLCAQAFHCGDRAITEDSGWIDPTEGNASTCGVFDSGGLQAVVTIFGFHVHLGPEAIVSEGTILAVACAPASRGKGYAGACLKYSLQRMRERGYVVSFLGPFSTAYYRRLGWEWVGHQRRYTVPARILRADRETEYVRAATAGDSCWTTRRRSLLASIALKPPCLSRGIQRDPLFSLEPQFAEGHRLP
jgi:predicted acetyltransferase